MLLQKQTFLRILVNFQLDGVYVCLEKFFLTLSQSVDSFCKY